MPRARAYFRDFRRRRERCPIFAEKQSRACRGVVCVRLCARQASFFIPATHLIREAATHIFEDRLSGPTVVRTAFPLCLVAPTPVRFFIYTRGANAAQPAAKSSARAREFLRFSSRTRVSLF